MDTDPRQIILPTLRKQGQLEGVPEPRLSGTADKLRTTWSRCAGTCSWPCSSRTC